jgi:hypothetical protein
VINQLDLHNVVNVESPNLLVSSGLPMVAI